MEPPETWPSTLGGSPLASRTLVLRWLMISTDHYSKLGGMVGEKCVNYLLFTPAPLFSRSSDCEARPGALTGKISTGGGNLVVKPSILSIG
jgi:hypothetical protein